MQGEDIPGTRVCVDELVKGVDKSSFKFKRSLFDNNFEIVTGSTIASHNIREGWPGCRALKKAIDQLNAAKWYELRYAYHEDTINCYANAFWR